jgi:signal peptidase
METTLSRTALSPALRSAGKALGPALPLICGALVLAALLVAGLPRLLGWQGVIVLSGSMEPALDVGGLAFVDQDRTAASIEVGEIVTYTSPTDPAVLQSHRVIEVLSGPNGPQLRTKGDANDLVDERLVQPAEVVGVVRWHVPYAGYVANTFRDRESYLLVVGIPALFLVAAEVRRIRLALRKQQAPTTLAVTWPPSPSMLPASAPAHAPYFPSHDV